MNKYLLYIFVLLMTVSSLSAQVTEIDGRIVDRKGVKPTPMAVEDFTLEGSQRPSVSDSIIMLRISEVIRADLNFSPFYEITPLDTFYMRHMELEVMSLLGWSHLGAMYVVRGKCEFSEDDVTIRYEMHVSGSGMVFARGRLKSVKTNHRRLAHKIANDIIYYLTGDKGIFDTKVCFISKRTGNKEIYLCDYDGANIYQLTGNGSINLSPSFDPDNRKILYTSFMNDDPELFQYDVVTGKVDPLAAYPGINSAARVSPDDQSIVCALSRDGNAELYLLERSGRIRRRLTYNKSIESSPCWSPTGREIAFTSDRTGSQQIYLMDKDGTNLRRLTYNGNYNDSPDWHPKGDKIVFLSRVNGKFNICTIDITGSNFRVLTERGNNENPHWSPDGNHIIFSSTRTGTKEIFIMDLYGNEEKRLTAGGGNSNPDWAGYPR